MENSGAYQTFNQLRLAIRVDGPKGEDGASSGENNVAEG